MSFLGGGHVAKDGTKIDYVRLDATAHDGRHHDFDPRVGMIGGSYGGQIQYAIAGMNRLEDAGHPFYWHPFDGGHTTTPAFAGTMYDDLKSSTAP